MWAVAGVLLALVVIVSLLGLHAGPHLHAFGAVLGLVAAGWLVAIAVSGSPWAGLWVLLSADVIVSGGMSVLAWKGLASRRPLVDPSPRGALSGEQGVAVTDLAPHGVVRVRGEQWSAVAVNGSAAAGALVQVLGADGLRLEVWADEASLLHTPAHDDRGDQS